jgi:hypothetical protein
MNDNPTAARTLMTTSGHILGAAGLAVTSTSTMYVHKYVINGCCGMVEYLPHMFNPDSQLTLGSHMETVNTGSWYAVGSTCLFLACGVLIRKMGAILTEDKYIVAVERFLYNAKPSTAKN